MKQKLQIEILNRDSFWYIQHELKHRKKILKKVFKLLK